MMLGLRALKEDGGGGRCTLKKFVVDASAPNSILVGINAFA